MRQKITTNTDKKAVMEDFQRMKQQQLIQQALKSKQLSPSVRLQLQEVMRIQNKGKADDAEQQRRIRERQLVGSATSIMDAPFIFKDDGRINPTEEIKELNPIRCPNVFKESPDGSDNILRPKRLNIMQTKEAGNNLKF